MVLIAMAMLLGPGDLRVTNLEAGSTLRYPLVMLRGAASDTDVSVGLSWRSMIHFPVVRNNFVALVELKPGKNMVLLNSGRDVLKMRLDYEPMKTPYRVATIYVAPKDENTDFDAPPGMQANQYGEKLDTAMKLLQCFTAESMAESGYGRKTFALEFEPTGQVQVHVVRSPKTGAELRAMQPNLLWDSVNELLGPMFPYDLHKCCAVMSFSRYDRAAQKITGHAALGGGGLGIFGGASMCLWPTRLQDVPKVFADATPIDGSLQFDDSGGRGAVWASVSTTLGAMLHEMGHTFGLPHSTDPRSIMSRGFDLFNRSFAPFEPPCSGRSDPLTLRPNDRAMWDPYFAARLNWNPWFQPDGRGGRPFHSANPPTIETHVGLDDVLVHSENGIRVAGAECEGRPSTYQAFTSDPPHELRLKLSDLQAKVGSKTLSVYALDDQGNEAHLAVGR